MPGKNIVFNPGQILFNKGDKSDGMFILRSGELTVFLEEQNGEDIELAKVGPGGMIGEMALFDSKPRSASVKASEKSEVTHITLKDFEKLMKQIPRWFTALMITLSSRLRTTNERVQELTDKLENLSPNNSGKLKKALEILRHINEVWQAKGEKVGEDSKNYKYFVIEKELAVKSASKKIEFTDEELSNIFKGLEKSKIAFDKDGTLHSRQKYSVGRFLAFLTPYLSHAKHSECEESSLILNCMKKLCDQSAYEPFSTTTDDIKDFAEKKMKKDVSKWEGIFPHLVGIHEDLKMLDFNGKKGFKIKKKVLIEIIKNHSAVSELSKAIT